MGKGEPCYVTQVFLHTMFTDQLPHHIMDNQLNMFHPHDPRSVVLNEVLIELRDLQLHADISRLRECLVQ
jgi:hypothetical protein